jgi:ribonucleoside-diphosphate reductase alpha chain
MRVLKRNGEYEDVSFDKTINRIRSHSTGLNIDIASIAQKVCSRIFDGVSTSDLDEFTSQICSSMMIDNPDLGILSSRIIISNHHKNTSPSFSETIYILYNYRNPINNRHTPLVSKTLYDITMNNREKINSYIKYDRDYAFDYFGFKTLERAYLIKINGKTIERPQHMFMRVALGIHGYDLKDALETYELMSQKFFTHATPTLFNAGTMKPQCSSCFLIAMSDDSIEGIYDTLKDCAKISQHAGGIGLHVHNIRAKNSFINGTNGYSNGLVPMLRVFNDTARYVDQCLHPDSIIYTKQGIKSIKDCVINPKGG